jgi:hypothetical protein
MFCAPELFFGGTKGVKTLFYILHSRTYFRQYRRRRVPFSCFALPDSFSAVPRASSPVFMFCSPGFVFGGTRGDESRFHVLRSETQFSAVPRMSAPVFMFCASELVFGDTDGTRPVLMFCAFGLIFFEAEGVGSPFLILCSRTHFRRNRWRRVQF